MQVACDEAGKVVKKQKTCASKTLDVLDKLIAAVSAAQQNASGGSSCDGALKELSDKLEQLAAVTELNSCTKELHASISKLGKAIDKVLDPQQEACKPIKELDFDEGILNMVIAEHLYREGRFEVADLLADEAGLMDVEQIRERYNSLHSILEQIRAHNLQPALEWAEAHRQQLSPEGQPSSFEFKLHALTFIHTLTTQGSSAALRYAKQHFSRFKEWHIQDIQRLMGCLVYGDRPPEATPYADLLSPCQWEEVAAEFTRQACRLLGQANESPLAVTVAAGAVALPALQKMAQVMAASQGQDLSSVRQLPVELELGREFVYHSIFACPVSREQSTPDNPPKLLPCNHVLCEQSIMRIAKARSRIFKCPYCPMEARADNCRSLVFPDLQR